MILNYIVIVNVITIGNDEYIFTLLNNVISILDFEDLNILVDR